MMETIQWVKSVAKAYVLIIAESGSETDVMKGLKKTNAVKEAHMVYGAYDIIARLEVDTMADLKDCISWKVRRLDGVRSTLAMIAM